MRIRDSITSVCNKSGSLTQTEHTATADREMDIQLGGKKLNNGIITYISVEGYANTLTNKEIRRKKCLEERPRFGGDMRVCS